MKSIRQRRLHVCFLSHLTATHLSLAVIAVFNLGGFVAISASLQSLWMYFSLSDRRAQSFCIFWPRSADCHKRIPDTKPLICRQLLNTISTQFSDGKFLFLTNELTLKQPRLQRQKHGSVWGTGGVVGSTRFDVSGRAQVTWWRHNTPFQGLFHIHKSKWTPHLHRLKQSLKIRAKKS